MKKRRRLNEKPCCDGKYYRGLPVTSGEQRMFKMKRSKGEGDMDRVKMSPRKINLETNFGKQNIHSQEYQLV